MKDIQLTIYEKDQNVNTTKHVPEDIAGVDALGLDSSSIATPAKKNFKLRNNENTKQKKKKTKKEIRN